MGSEVRVDAGLVVVDGEKLELEFADVDVVVVVVVVDVVVGFTDVDVDEEVLRADLKPA